MLTSDPRYLWISLQIDSIFPSYAKTVITEERTRDLITNLPKDLPDAFERALERIIDKTYQGNLLKLVMAAKYLLTIDEVRMVMALRLGDTRKWYPERVPKDGAQLIALSGGNLLDIDEEDGKVRFIHHSVLKHLLSPARNTSTIPYHFSLEQAHNFTGSMCVTYLNLPLFESRMIASRKVEADEILEKMTTEAKRNHSMISLLAQHMKPRKRLSPTPYQLDLGRLILQSQTLRLAEDFDPRCFASYALANWLYHTRFFHKDDREVGSCWTLWWRLLSGHIEQVKPPFTPVTESSVKAVLLWAKSNQHYGLLRIVLQKCLHTREDQLIYLIHEVHRPESVDDAWVECLMSVLFYDIDSTDSPTILNQHMHESVMCRVRFLAALGADLIARPNRVVQSGGENYFAMDLLVQALDNCILNPADFALPTSAVKIYMHKLTRLLENQVAQYYLLKGRWLVESVADMVAVGNISELRAVLAHHPKVVAKYYNGFSIEESELPEKLPVINELLKTTRKMDPC